MVNAAPSIDPANDGSLLGTLKTVLRKFLMGTDDMLPARVIAFNRDTNRVQVQLMVMMRTTAGEIIPRPQIAEIPVFQIGGGGFILNFPLQAGDLGWVKASDRDISLFLQSYAEAPPNTDRLHSFSDAIFFPDVMRGFTIDGEDAGNVVLQTVDGNCRVAIWPDKVKVTAPTVVLDTPLVHATTHMNIDGQLQVGLGITWGTITPSTASGTGDLSTTGEITAKAGSTNVKLSNHVHSGVSVGTQNTGGPI